MGLLAMASEPGFDGRRSDVDTALLAFRPLCSSCGSEVLGIGYLWRFERLALELYFHHACEERWRFRLKRDGAVMAPQDKAPAWMRANEPCWYRVSDNGPELPGVIETVDVGACVVRADIGITVHVAWPAIRMRPPR